jgi:hypothetical protein
LEGVDVTTTDPRIVPTDVGARQVQNRSLDELEHYLRPTHFPARLDQLLATLSRHRAPSRVYWLLASLPLSSTFDDLPQLLAVLGPREASAEEIGPHHHPEPI